MSDEGRTNRDDSIGLSTDQVSTLIGKPYQHRQQRQVYEAGRRQFAGIIRQRLAAIEQHREVLATEADNLRRWLEWERGRPTVAGPKGYGGL